MTRSVVDPFEAGGYDLIVAERQRQIEREGWTPEHDDHHSDGEMYAAALCYLRANDPAKGPSNLWPWEHKWWKPKDRLSNLVRAGALLMAERDRYNRKKLGTGAPWPVPVEIPFLIQGIAMEIDEVLANAA